MEKLEDYKKKYGEIYYKLHLIEDVNRSKNIYSDLYFFEVYLRYNVNEEFKRVYGRFWQNLDEYKILKYKKNLLEYFNITVDEMIAFNNIYKIGDDLSLGFWIKLFGKKFHQKYIDKTIDLKKIFPAMPLKDDNNPEKKTRDITEIYKDLQKIRDFRNKIFHFEAEALLPKIEEYKELIQKYIKYLDCDDIFLNRNIFDSNSLKNKVEKEYIKNCTKLYNNVDIVYYTSTEHELKKEELNKIVNEEQMQEFERMHGNFEEEHQIEEPDDDEKAWAEESYDEEEWQQGWEEEEQRQMRYIQINHTVIKKIKNSNNDIKIIVTDFRDVTTICHKELAIDNKKIFITTPKDLPNLLNKIANDNAN